MGVFEDQVNPNHAADPPVTSLPDTGKVAKAEQLDGFETAVKNALENWGDVQWLGTYSPLAQPYVIGRFIRVGSLDDSVLERGRTLQQLLRDALDQLPIRLQGVSSDPRKLLRLSYFERNPRWTLQRLAQELNLAISSYYRHRADAIRALATQIHRSIHPPFQTEAGLSAANRLCVGREDIIHRVGEQLQPGHPIALIGPSGIGKTTLALEIARRFARSGAIEPTGIFFYTLQIGLTDYLSSVVFALAHFLRQHGADKTWKQLVADHGKIRHEVIHGMLRFDLESVRSQPLILCIDEVGLLSVERQSHLEIVELLQNVSEFAATLWIGQRLPLSAEESYSLIGLSESDVADLLSHLKLQFTPTELSTLCRVTRGNPALIKLFSSLYRTGNTASVGDTLSLLGRTPSTEFVFYRIWSRLKEEERSLLMQLSVFQEASPKEAWQDTIDTLDQLLELGLVREAGQGQVEIVPHIANLTYESSPIEIRPALHLRAAHIHETRGNYTLALHYFVNGGQSVYGLWLWHAHRVDEVERGYAALALQSLQQINPLQLAHDMDRVVLATSLSQLYMLAGRPERAEEELRQAEPQADGANRAFIQQCLGYALEAQNRNEAALESFRQAIDLWTANPLRHIAQLHGERSRLLEQGLGSVQQARREALLSRLTSEVFCGIVEEHQGNYDAAQQLYESALNICGEVSNSKQQQAFISFAAGNLAWKQNRISAAINLLNLAIQLCEQIGDSYRPAYGRRNLSAAYIIAGDYVEAIRQAQLGLHIAVPLNHSELIAGLTANAGEAHYYLQQYELAEGYALQSLGQEELKERPVALTILGMVYRAQHRLDESIKHLKEAVKTAQDVEDKYSEAAAWRQLGETHAVNQQSAEALAAYSLALTHYQHMKLDKEIGELHTLIERSS